MDLVGMVTGFVTASVDRLKDLRSSLQFGAAGDEVQDIEHMIPEKGVTIGNVPDGFTLRPQKFSLRVSSSKTA
jgi:hypothetical protein